MYYQYPLETLARLRGTRSQIAFAREAKSALRDDDDMVSEPLDHGLAIFAANEAALERPARILEELYGAQVEVRRPRVRLMSGETVQQPVMQVRVRARREHLPGVLRALRHRGVELVEECVRSREVIVRGQANLSDLMGLPAELSRITGDSAAHWIRLTHYAPLPAPLSSI